MEANLTDNEAFNQAVTRLNAFKKKPEKEDLLSLYGYYKQGTAGDVNIERPGMLDFKGRHKWDAWNKNKGMSKAEAQDKYIALVDKLSAEYA